MNSSPHSYYSTTVDPGCQFQFTFVDLAQVQTQLQELEKDLQIKGYWKVEKAHVKDEKTIILSNQYSFLNKDSRITRYGINCDSLNIVEDYTISKDRLHYIEYKVIAHALEDLKTQDVLILDFFVRKKNPMLIKSPHIDIHTVVLAKHKNDNDEESDDLNLIIVDPNRKNFSEFLAKLIEQEFPPFQVISYLRDVYSNELPDVMKNCQSKYHATTRDCIDISAQIALKIKEKLFSKSVSHITKAELVEIATDISNVKKLGHKMPGFAEVLYLPEYLSWDLDKREKVRFFLCEESPENKNSGNKEESKDPENKSSKKNTIYSLDKMLQINSKAVSALNFEGMVGFFKDFGNLKTTYLSCQPIQEGE